MNCIKGQKDRTLKDEPLSPPKSEGLQHATAKEQRTAINSARKKETAEPEQKPHSVAGVSDDECKIQCCKEQFCTETWNVRSMNQGKLDVVNQEMAKVNIDILAISELKWMRMGEFNSNDNYIYYCGQKSLRRNGVALKVNKRV